MAGKGVIVEFDFTVLNGAGLLFETAREFLRALDGIEIDEALEARHLAGNGYLAGLRGLFATVKTKKTAQKAARELSAAFDEAVTAAARKAAQSMAFRNFVRALDERGVTVVISTRADLEQVHPAFEALVGEHVRFYREITDGYGFPTWDAWRRACAAHRLSYLTTRAVTGSGFGVKSALQARMGALAVINDHVAYQDFGGADAVVGELSGKTAKKVLEMMRI